MSTYMRKLAITVLQCYMRSIIIELNLKFSIPATTDIITSVIWTVRTAVGISGKEWAYRLM